jgi:formylglycine-generating enzyme required for sulfatase activity
MLRVMAVMAFAAGIGAAQQEPFFSYEGPEGHAMVVIRGGEFTMGSPAGEPGRDVGETPHRVRIPRVFAIATKEVTNEQFERFLAAVPDDADRWRRAAASRFGDPPRFRRFSRTPDSPQVAVSWYDAARYCNWLSERAALPRTQWIYPQQIDAERGIDLPPDYLHRTGYRLPTEAEWEFAARAGTSSSRHFSDRGVLAQYAWYDANTDRERAYPVGQLRPNQWGFYDMLGNVWEWTFDRRLPYPPERSGTTEDTEDRVLRVRNHQARTRRGGSFAYDAANARSANRGDATYFPDQIRDNVGFRVARTMP